MAALLADAVSQRKTTPKRLLAELSGRPRQRNRGVLRDVLGDVSRGAHSALERRYLVQVERAHHLPTAVRQQQALRSYRSDCWYDEYRLLVELDSKLHHSGGAAFRDMNRDNEHALLGLTTLRFGWRDVTGVGACHTARIVAQFLMTNGWEGPLQPCPHCRLVPDSEARQYRAPLAVPDLTGFSHAGLNSAGGASGRWWSRAPGSPRRRPGHRG